MNPTTEHPKKSAAPTWTAVWRIYAENYNHEDREVRDAARNGLAKMARMADKYVGACDYLDIEELKSAALPDGCGR